MYVGIGVSLLQILARCDGYTNKKYRFESNSVAHSEGRLHTIDLVADFITFMRLDDKIKLPPFFQSWLRARGDAISEGCAANSKIWMAYKACL